MTAAASWEASSDALPPEVTARLESSNDPLLVGQRLLMAVPEWQVSLPGGETTSNTDVMAVCRNEAGLCVIGVEAKVLEAFGPLVGEKRTDASPGQTARLGYLHSLLKVGHFEDQIRYQLLHRTASALLTAREFHAASAVMLVQAFGTPPERRNDFEAFRKAMNATEISPLIFKVPAFDTPVLYLAWCDGDPQFLKTRLPSSSIET